MIGQKIQHYEIISRLGAGGMGEVFLATDTKLGRKVALKFLPREFATDPERRRRLELEATSASSIDHPNILTIYEINDHEGQPFIAMAYVDGETLKDRIARGRLSLEQAIRYAIQLSSALGAAHAHGIIHRDVKPDNVLIGKDDRARLTDFGLAKMKESSGLTNRGATVGTVGYMSPEQAQGMPVDSRSDVFSLGVVLYEMFSGKLPFAAEHAAAALYSIVHETPAPLKSIDSKIPDPIVAVIERALAKKADERYHDGAAMETDLRAVARAMEISRISSGQLPVYRSNRKRRVLWAVSGIAAIVIGIFFALNGSGPANLRPGEAVATENTLAVFDFENLSDQNDTERQGDIIADLLTTDLSASEYIKVVSSQRLYDLAKHGGGDGNDKIEKSEAIEIARMAGATRMLSGAISKLGGRSIITAQIVDVSTGEVVGSERVDGDDLFAMVDDLSYRIKTRIGLSESEALAGDVPVAEATTSNAEAYRAYVQGMEFYLATNWDEAHKHFDRAIALDSTFALAYLRKGIAYFSDARSEEGYRTMAMARHFMDRVTGCDRILFQALAVDISEKHDFAGGLRTLKRGTVECPTQKEFFFWVANFSRSGASRYEPDTVIAYLEKALELDPNYPYAFLVLIDAYMMRENYDRARELAFRYKNARPNDVYPYECIGDIFLKKQQFDSARYWYTKAIEVGPDQRNGYREIARIHVLQGRPDSAIAWYAKTLASDNALTRSLALRSTGNVHKAWGRFNEAVGYYQKAAAMSEQQGLRDQEGDAHANLAWLYFNTGRPELALDAFKRAAKCDTVTPEAEIGQALALARMGKVDEARTRLRAVNDEWRGRIDSANIKSGELAFEATIDLDAGNFQSAFDRYKAARVVSNDTTKWRESVAEALLGLGRYDEALREIATIRKEAELTWPSEAYLHSLYMQADAYMKLNRSAEAVEPLQRLMVFWGDPDWEVPWLKDAKNLYSSLTAQ